MRAIVYSAPGGSEVLSLVDREIAAPGTGEVRVRVAVSGVNPTDWKSRAGGTQRGDFAEVVPNQDGAGIIDAVGDGVAGLAVGDRVWIHLAQHQRPTGTAQEYTIVPASCAIRLPEGVSFELAASLGVPAVTAHRALTVHEDGPTRLSPGALEGRTILVAGGAGAVGHAAIQLARWAGATVIATVSSDEKAALARAAGAHHTVDYTAGDLVAQVKALATSGIDQFVEVSLATNAAADAELAANHAVIAFYADNNGETFSMPIRPTFAKNLRVQGVLLYTVGEPALDAAIDDITRALEDDALPVGDAHGLPLIWFDLDQTAAAHDAVENAAVGKVLIRIADL